MSGLLVNLLRGASASGTSSAAPTMRAGVLFGIPQGDTPGTSTPSLNSLAASPMELPAVTLDRIGIEVTTGGGAGAVVRLGIYSDTNGVPDALVLDAGTVDSTGTGIKTITISQALSAGVYWLATVSQVATSVVRTVNGGPGRIAIADNAFSGTFSLNGYSASAAASGALPASFGAIGQGVASAPRVLLRRT